MASKLPDVKGRYGDTVVRKSGRDSPRLGVAAQPLFPRRDIIDYLSRFTDWRPYEHRVLADTDAVHVRMPVNRTTLNRLYGLDLSTDEDAEAFAARAEPVDPIVTSADGVISPPKPRDLFRFKFKIRLRLLLGNHHTRTAIARVRLAKLLLYCHRPNGRHSGAIVRFSKADRHPRSNAPISCAITFISPTRREEIDGRAHALRSHSDISAPND